MDADKLQQIQAHVRAIAALLYDETAPEQLTTLEGIETAVRGNILEYVSPEMVIFYGNGKWDKQRTTATHQEHPWGDQYQ